MPVKSATRRGVLSVLKTAGSKVRALSFFMHAWLALPLSPSPSLPLPLSSLPLSLSPSLPLSLSPSLSLPLSLYVYLFHLLFRIVMFYVCFMMSRTVIHNSVEKISVFFNAPTPLWDFLSMHDTVVLSDCFIHLKHAEAGFTCDLERCVKTFALDSDRRL